MTSPAMMCFAGTLAAASVLLIGCASRPAAHDASAPCCPALAPAPLPPAASGSLYDLAGTWTADTGERRLLSSLRGQRRVVTMFYTSCEMTCPMTLEVMRRMELQLEPDVRGRVGFVLITLDPGIDTPKVLRRFRRAHGLSTDRWTLLHGSHDQVARAAAILGVNYGRDKFGRLSHSALVSALDETGRVLERQAGLKGDLRPMIACLRRDSLPTTPSR